MTGRAAHISGVTFHGRRGAITNAFRYSIDYVMMDAENTPALPWLMGRNRRGFASLRDVDHGGAPGAGRGSKWVREILKAEGAEEEAARIELLAQPRFFGHVFNPVSFWLVFDAADDLRSVIAEVTNTFGDRHSYLARTEDGTPITRSDVLKAKKIFHVSPFQPVGGEYEFRFDIREDRIGIWIDYRHGDGGVYATLTGVRRPLTSLGLLAAALRRPLGSRRVLALIHWQALKLWWKGARYRVRPEPPVEELSR